MEKKKAYYILCVKKKEISIRRKRNVGLLVERLESHIIIDKK